MSRLALAIDGGATATRAAVVSERGLVLGHGVGGPCMPLLTAEARRTAGEHVARAVETALAAVDRPPDRPLAVGAVWAGLTGLDNGTSAEEWLRQTLATLDARLSLEGPVRVSSDLETALEGALGPSAPGIMVYAGTGSVAVARDPAGRLHRAGGQGYLIDDRGGGFDLGRMALQAVVRAWDGRGDRTSLEGLVQTALRVSGWEELRRAVYGAPNPKAVIAGLAPLVARAAEQGDPVALAIVDDAARELARLALALLQRLRGVLDAPVRVRFAGGAFRNRPLREAFVREMGTRAPQAEVTQGLLPPLGGAALLALRSAGLASPQPDAVVEHLSRALGPA